MSDLSQFDPEAFLDSAITTELKKRPPLAVGTYSAAIGEPKSRTWQGRKDPSKSGIALSVPLLVDVPFDQQAAVGQPQVTLTDSIMLDLTENGGLDLAPGRNRRLRQYYDATDLNKPGSTPRMLQGRVIRVAVNHEIYEGEPVERVGNLAKAG